MLPLVSETYFPISRNTQPAPTVHKMTKSSRRKASKKYSPLHFTRLSMLLTLRRPEAAARLLKSQHNATTPLLKLPAELRLQIYEELIPEGHRIRTRILDEPSVISPLLICRQIKNEITPVFWSRAVICLDLYRSSGVAKINLRSLQKLNPPTSFYGVEIHDIILCALQKGIRSRGTLDIEIGRCAGPAPFHFGNGHSMDSISRVVPCKCFFADRFLRHWSEQCDDGKMSVGDLRILVDILR
jgi:hypothetical protein